ncbi:MAG: ATP-binding protein [Canidatus Methanoxibalbensis ujae]|nr:ATP-binding protein [Candidatus Methanoxibalbensis ujae]
MEAEKAGKVYRGWVCGLPGKKKVVGVMDAFGKRIGQFAVNRVRLELIKDEIHYSVKDTGIGLPFEKQEMVFEKFYEIQDVVNHKTSNQEFMGGGLGIGLSLVKEMVNGMKGRIILESEPGQGSLFKVILPGYQVEQEAPGNVLQGSNNAN